MKIHNLRKNNFHYRTEEHLKQIFIIGVLKNYLWSLERVEEFWMDNNLIVSRMNGYLHKSLEIMVEWLGELLPKTSEDWWEECVLEKLSTNQAEMAREKGYTELRQLDLAALLRIAYKSWYEMRAVAYLPSDERDCIRDMMRVRNNWAHVTAELPGKDTILTDLDTLHLFFRQRGCDENLLSEVEKLIEEVKTSSTVDITSLTQREEPHAGNEQEAAADENITEKSMVYIIGNPDERGIVISVNDLGNTKKYGVFVNGNLKTYYSGQIALYVEEPSYNWVDISAFRSYLTAYQINNPSRTDLYSLNSARIDFVPYQFRPALKLIHSDDPRILIADSVGVGKTIEAGLIIKELQARKELESVVVICPKPLVTERKWEMEMKRFDEEFVPVDGPLLRQLISDMERDGEWSIRYNKIIVPYSVLDSRTYEGDKTKHTLGLRNLDPAPHFDLVIVDEAHHIRNGSMEKEKAFEYKCVKYFCDHADAVVMLTATPLQTSDNDLFTLLNVLRPDVIIDKQTFDIMSRPNAYISQAARAIRSAGENWQANATKALAKVLETQWGENVIAANPAYATMLKTLRQENITREERVKLISEAESLHSFYSMLNRTRRKDIQDFCIRRPYSYVVEFTPLQRELHDEILKFESAALLQIHRNAGSIPFMMSTLKRQAASCIFGLAPHIRDLIERRFMQLDDDPDTDMDCIKFPFFEPHDAETLEDLAQNILRLSDNLPEEDRKFDKMLGVIMEKQALENNKIIIFSTFRYTLHYLKRKLIKAGLRVDQVDGSVKDDVRQELRERFELPKENENAIDILLFTEVGSEGLDYQFCNMMINYDLPWNPMKIEQRIGRIDRRGQQSETVSICNMITDETVDADIYFRCLLRIGIFESSIGECEEILGDLATEIDHIAMNASLTAEERKTKLEQIADNNIRRIQEMNRLEDEEKELFGFDLSEQMTSQEIQKAENPWLTQKNLQILIEQYLIKRLGEGKYIVGEKSEKQLSLSSDAKKELRDDFRKLAVERNMVHRTWDLYLKGDSRYHAITFDAETAEKKREAFLITKTHPLAKQAAAYFASNDIAYIRLQYATESLPRGTYRFSVYAWSYVGLHPHFRLVVVCDDDAIAAELHDILTEAQSGAAAVKMQPSDWDELERKQVAMWKAEKAAEIKDAETLSKFKIESLSSNFNNLKRSLEQKISDAGNESIRRMYSAQLDNAIIDNEHKVDEIRKKQNQTDIHSTLIANGILDVVN